MHRGFFAKAMTDNSSDPLSGKYGHSVLRAQESSAFFVKLIRSLWIYQQQLAERNWFLFTHVFSCAVRSKVKQKDVYSCLIRLSLVPYPSNAQG